MQSLREGVSRVRQHFQSALRRKKLYASCFETGNGRWVLEDMMAAHHVFKPRSVTASKATPDGVAMALEQSRRDGEAAVVLRILTLMSYNEADILKMEAEMVARQQDEDDDYA